MKETLVKLISNILYYFIVSYFKTLKAITMILNGKMYRLRCRDQKRFQIYCVSTRKMDVLSFQYSIKVNF